MGPGYQRLEWFKDGAVFPWDIEQAKSRNSILYRLTSSLAIISVRMNVLQ